MRIRLVAVAASLFLAAAPLQAQSGHGAHRGQGHQGMMDRGDMMGMMMTDVGPAPQMLLAASDFLGLSTEQTERLEGLVSEARSARETHMKPAMEARRRAAEAVRGEEPDFDAFRAAMDEHHAHMIQARVAMLEAAHEARGVLTEEQESRLHEAMQLMRQMHGMARDRDEGRHQM